jgi:hypothetical protein
MSTEPRRIAPRSAVSGAHLEPLTVAVVELETGADDPAPSLAELARRLVRFRGAPPTENLEGGVIVLGSIGLPG